MGIWDHAELATKRLRNASNYIRKKGVGSSYAFENTLPRDIALGRLFCGCVSRRFSSVPLGVFTLDRVLLPEKRILKSLAIFLDQIVKTLEDTRVAVIITHCWLISLYARPY